MIKSELTQVDLSTTDNVIYAPIVFFVYNRPWHTQQAIEALQKNELQSALESVWKIVNRANKYVEQTQPFKIAKDDPRLDEVLYNLVESCRVIAVCVWPFLPQTAKL